MGEEEPPTDYTTVLMGWLLKSKFFLGFIIGIFLAPTMDLTTTRILDLVLPGENAGLEEMTESMPMLAIRVERVEILSRLVQDRHILDGVSNCPPTLEFVQALHRVPLLYAEETDVVNNYNILMQDPGRSPVAFASMISTMAEALEIEAPVLLQKGFPYECE